MDPKNSFLFLVGTWWLVGFTGVMMPGPVSAMTFTESARRGFWAGPLITAGHALAELAMVLALALGIGEALQHNWLVGAIGFFGGLFLLWMGFDIARTAWLGRVTLDGQPATTAPGSRQNLVVTGLLVSVVNPYWVLWWATVGTGYLLLFVRFGVPGIVVFYLAHISTDLLWNSLLSFVVASGRRILSQRVYRGILVACGLFLMALSVYFIGSGVSFLRG
ncbi:MAG: LysE family transporter [Anaerolineae bacterium]